MISKEVLPRIGRRVLGRKRFARLARFLWLRSRSDVPNDFHTNGEHALQKLLADELRPGENFVAFDVGANVGDWSEPLVSQFAGIHEVSRLSLHLFEPSPDSCAKLEERLQNCECNLVLNQCAVGRDTVETVPFHRMGETSGTNTLQPGATDAVRDVIDVRCTSLDDYCRRRGIDHVDFVKVDVEGLDLDVLTGAAGLLERRAIRFLQFEYNHRWVFSRSYLKDVFDLVRPHGYEVGKITPQGVDWSREWHPELESFREGNYLIWCEEPPGQHDETRWWDC